MKLRLRCKMQDNGFKQALSKELTILECRKQFVCEVKCNNCPCLEVKDG